MATGITKHEQLSEDAISASDFYREPISLPEKNEIATLTYSRKASLDDVIYGTSRNYLKIESSSNKRVEAIPINSFILDDNIFVLNELLRTNKKARLFYLDPPYGTGLDFQCRDLKHAYKDKMGQAEYIEFMRRRLILMRECLEDDGSIYVHIGHQMLAHLKIVMDEIFGVNNFRNLITRRKCSSKNFTRNQYANLNDYILFYTKTNSYVWNQPGVLPEKEWIEKEYPKIDDFGRRFKLVPIHAPGTRNGETGKEWRGKLPPPGKHWQYKPSKLDEFDREGDIHWSRNGNPRRKVYWNSDKKRPLTNYWQQYRDAHHQSIKITGYPTEKNFEMLKMIIEASSNPGDLVIDPFSGSGTTIHAARELGRRYMGIDASFSAAKATMYRMQYGLQSMGDYVNKEKKSKAAELPLRCSDSDLEDCIFIVDSKLWEEYKDEIDKIRLDIRLQPLG